MLYIDFTTPDGKTYRIDALKTTFTYECPICGEITIGQFDPDEDYCFSCNERREEERKERDREDFYSHLASFHCRDRKHNNTAKETLVRHPKVIVIPASEPKR